jgi:glycosyltransferase involved in cell wall biosynthesis
MVKLLPNMVNNSGQKRPLFIVYSNLDIGGIPTKIIDIVNTMGITKSSIPIYILLQKGNRNDLRSLIHNQNAQVIDFKFPFKNGKRLFYIFWVWYFIIIKNPSCILAFISPYAIPVLTAKILYFWKKLHIVISEDHYTETIIRDMAYPKLNYLGVRYLYPFSNVVIVPAKSIKKQLLRISNISDTKIISIPNWTRHANSQINRSYRKYVIAHLGRLAKTKNPMHVLKIMDQFVHEIDSSSKCAIVGDGPIFPEMEKYIINRHLQNNIELLHGKSDVSEILSQAKVLLFIPELKTESYPIIILDAMACGTVVITKKFEGYQEMLKDNENCFICESDKEIISCLKQIINNRSDTNKIITNAKEGIQTHNTIRNADRYISELRV